jgi:predicted phosphate transport protein (TIGR00153 family)
MLRGILPKEYAFYDHFDKLIDIDKQISTLFLNMIEKGGDMVETFKSIKVLEREADKIARNCTDLLHKTFITPIDRNDIFTLVKRLDDLADQITAAAFRLATYDVREIRSEAVEFSKIIHACIEELVLAINALRKMKKNNKVRESLKRVHELENQADEILRNAISRLFSEGEALVMIKWKEIFERLEKAVDRCEDVASTIESILIENS